VTSVLGIHACPDSGLLCVQYERARVFVSSRVFQKDSARTARLGIFEECKPWGVKGSLGIKRSRVCTPAPMVAKLVGPNVRVHIRRGCIYLSLEKNIYTVKKLEV
jgi:hypothetical protein